MLLKLMVVGTHWSLQSTCFVIARAKLAPGSCKQDQDPHLQGNILNSLVTEKASDFPELTLIAQLSHLTSTDCSKSSQDQHVQH